MRVSGFTFLRNAAQLGYPFIASIRSLLPLVDECIIVVGKSQDNTLDQIQALAEADSKIKIIETEWNPHMTTKGFVYGEQKMIGQYACTGDWAFYLEADEVIHEQDYPAIRAALAKHWRDPRVEALIFDYWHFYGNTRTYAWSPAWYRRAPRIIKTAVRSYAPDGLFWLVLDKNNKKGRYPRAAMIHAPIYHYGWVRPESQHQEKFVQVQRYWSQGQETAKPQVDYRAIDPLSLREFKGTHPALMQGYYPEASGIFETHADYQLTRRERKNRWGLCLERWFGCDLSKKHFQRVVI
jgi:hypothetical protein